ncbi:glycerol kinase GlpK [Robertkochia marina]|uniref:Glycerol kinase n=1 Tax=Robertkochia marina TaxID=1227945 RepID=A0A4S3M548_9FLAO|nr:glycerol kinase GlpK [Robertkochia marina]THD69461.1 glycerol kinase GlpK [Robertkochia marina]TRZ47278.1 glycerol kinase [Robertkochia marina]
MKQEYIVALDQGTTSSRALLVDLNGRIAGMKQKEFKQYFPEPGWVEHDPEEIISSQIEVLKDLISDRQIHPDQIKTIGITNQRETVVVWNKLTGKPIYNAIVWQDSRTASICESLKNQGLSDYVSENTGLLIDSYFSGTKIRWILDNVEGAREEAEAGNLCFGTIDTWLIQRLTIQQQHLTDLTNASRTMLFNIRDLCWDSKLFEALEIPKSMAPEVLPSAAHFGDIEIDGKPIPVMGIAGDQQAALFGQGCFTAGEAKNTYGTGCFMLMNTGKKIKRSKNGLITTIAWGLDNEVYYALEGSIFVAGAAVQWLRDELKFFEDAAESEPIALELKKENPVYVVPAFAGLGAPYWDMYARGAIFGLTRDTGIPHITRATLDSLAYQTRDILDAMQKDAQTELTELKVDGGASSNNYLMQFQADILNNEVIRHQSVESTALGAASLAAYASGIWTLEEIRELKTIERVFTPNMSHEQRSKRYTGWKKAVGRSRQWLEEHENADKKL